MKPAKSTLDLVMQRSLQTSGIHGVTGMSVPRVGSEGRMAEVEMGSCQLFQGSFTVKGEMSGN